MPGSHDAAPTDFRVLFEGAPGLYLVLLPDAPRYTIVAVSEAYARALTSPIELQQDRPVRDGVVALGSDNMVGY